MGLKVFDCYRPVRAVAHFVRWAQRIDDVKRKAEFYPNIDKRDLFKLGYIATRSGHSRGSTVDITLARHDDKAELDMGTPYDFSDPKSWTSDRSVSAEGCKNRALLIDAMTRGGFKSYHKEWWHFSLPPPGSPIHFPTPGGGPRPKKNAPGVIDAGRLRDWEGCGSGQAALRLPAACLPRSVTTS